MASAGITSASQEISPSFDKLLKDVTANLSPEELKQAVSSIKTNFEGKFNAKDDQDLYSCLHLFANQGVVSEDNLTLLEKFVVTPHTSKKATIEEKIHNFKATRPFQEPRKEELTGRNRDLTNVISLLTTDRSSVLNLYGSSGVGKTRLATEAFCQWRGPKFKVDLREVDEMKDVHFHVFVALSERSGMVEVSYEANTVIAKMEQVKRNSKRDILLFLDNADKFVAVANQLNASFGSLLDRLLDIRSGKTTRTNLKILLTSRCEFRHGSSLKVQNHELRALARESSDQLLLNQGRISEVPINQREKLVDMCKGKPLLLNGMAAILRQEIADAERLLGTIEQELDVSQSLETEPPSKETKKVERFDVIEEGIDQEQLSCLRKIFFFLPSKTLQDSAVSLSLFCRPFTVETAAKILDVESSEAAIRLEGLRNSEVMKVTQDKELHYDIHPLMRNFLKSVGNTKRFFKAFQKSKENFSKHFVSRLTELSSLLDEDFVKASESFEVERQNFEVALDISLKSDFLLISKEHHESLMICYFLEAMLDANQRRRIFRSWADKAMEDSVFRSEMRCQEALQVLKFEGWRKAADVLKEAKVILSRMPKDRRETDSFKLARSSYLFAEGEVYYVAGNFPRALKVLNKSLKIMEVLLKSHTSTSRCLNSIGNCYNKLIQPEEAIKYYQRALAMRQDLSCSGEHCDMPLFQNQIGTFYEAQKQFHEAINHYKKALDLATKLKLPGVLYTALCNRNISNAYAWLGMYDQAFEYGKKAYTIRKDVLGNHPLTARSAFQMAEICLHLDEFDEADEYYEEAWQIERSLGQGNHSEVRDRIISSYRKKLSEERKKVFEEEVFEFYRRCWDEERSCEDFAFTQANKNIIDHINERLESGGGDKEMKKKYQREALWFYEGTWKSPDTKRLPYEFREEIIAILLRLCSILGEKELLRRYKVDEFKFYEKRWKKDRKDMKHQDKYDILSTLVDRATFLCYDEKVVKYNKLLQEVKRPSEPYLPSLPPFGAEALDDDIDDDISDKIDMEDDSTAGDDDDETMEQLQIEEEEEVVSTSVGENEIASDDENEFLGDLIDLHVFFPPGAVSGGRISTVRRWNPRFRSPPLFGNEAVVSDVIELSLDSPGGLHFDEAVTLVIPHCASDLKGYEVVVKSLITGDEWKDVETVDWRTKDDIKEDYDLSGYVPDFSFPVAACKITQCSTFAVVCRLKSRRHVVTSQESELVWPEFPLAKMSFPPNAVPKDESFELQEVSQGPFRKRQILPGPILRITSSKAVDFLKPVAVQLPLSLSEAHRINIDMSGARVRILFKESKPAKQEWIEITEKLETPPRFDGNIISFTISHFSVFWTWVEWLRSIFPFRRYANTLETDSVPMEPLFAVYVPKDTCLHDGVNLRFRCSRITRRYQLDDEEKKQSNVKIGGGRSNRPMYSNEKAFVFLSQGIAAPGSQRMYLRFQEPSCLDVKVLVENQGQLTASICGSQEGDEDDILCELNVTLPPRNDNDKTPVEVFGLPFDDAILLKAPLEGPYGILTACREVLHEIGQGRIYDHHKGSEDPKTFLMALSRLDPEHKEWCFDKIVSTLAKSDEGPNSVVRNHLMKAHEKIDAPINERVWDLVADRFNRYKDRGAYWKTLARDLRPKIPKSDIIDTQNEEEGSVKECCRVVLQKWYQRHTSSASSKELMRCLTNMGLANVNWQIMKELGLVNLENIPLSER
ncbi:Nephrocystin-3 [Acropora cervicornis]|uniref:Nephrocystin-3 n=1 Tax=Acropora cervicornis TaxID=6130 RepID=A0AAD9V413_ACRCE|nr:Nephrocystin-3 [Acropora cervicornis]